MRFLFSSFLAGFFISTIELLFFNFFVSAEIEGGTYLKLALIEYSIVITGSFFISGIFYPFCFFSGKIFKTGNEGRIFLIIFTLIGGILFYFLNAMLYVRLYLLFHILLSILSILLIFLSFYLLLFYSKGNLKIRALKILPFIFLFLFILSFFIIKRENEIRFLAIEKTTTLSHFVMGILKISPHKDSFEIKEISKKEKLPDPNGILKNSNLILITIDAFRYDCIKKEIVPNFYSLIKKGVFLKRAYSPSSWTNHTMYSIFTSLLPSETKWTYVSVDYSDRFVPFSDDAPIVRNPLHFKKLTPVPFYDKNKTLAEILNENGYFTATFITYVFYQKEGGITKGFELINKEAYIKRNWDNEGVTSDMQTDLAIDFLKNNNKKPFFLWLHYQDPHAPYIKHNGFDFGDNDEERYYSELSFVDFHIGRLFSEIISTGLMNNTLIIIHSDHGEEFGDHGGKYHATTLYEEIIRVPFLMIFPLPLNALNGREIERAVSLIDLMPTITDLLGINVDLKVRGKSIFPLISAEKQEPIFSTSFRFQSKKTALILYPYKLIHDEVFDIWELYNLSSDPYEKNNKVSDEKEKFEFLKNLFIKLK